ncbi:MAG: MFS transporter, partial [Desulfovibrionales bacterium]|nr:MFS transporter [Desulfovibrionales bacterium]
LMLVAISYALLPWCTSGTELVGVAIISGLGGGIAMPLQAALMFDLSAPRARAMNQNLLVVMMQGGFFLGPLSGGFILEHWNFTVFFVLLAGLTVLSAGLLLWLRPQQTH